MQSLQLIASARARCAPGNPHIGKMYLHNCKYKTHPSGKVRGVRIFNGRHQDQQDVPPVTFIMVSQVQMRKWSPPHWQGAKRTIGPYQTSKRFSLYKQGAKRKSKPHEASQPVLKETIVSLSALLMETCGRPSFRFAAAAPHRHATRCLPSPDCTQPDVYVRSIQKAVRFDHASKIRPNKKWCPL